MKLKVKPRERQYNIKLNIDPIYDLKPNRNFLTFNKTS